MLYSHFDKSRWEILMVHIGEYSKKGVTMKIHFGNEKNQQPHCDLVDRRKIHQIIYLIRNKYVVCLKHVSGSPWTILGAHFIERWNKMIPLLTWSPRMYLYAHSIWIRVHEYVYMHSSTRGTILESTYGFHWIRMKSRDETIPIHVCFPILYHSLSFSISFSPFASLLAVILSLILLKSTASTRQPAIIQEDLLQGDAKIILTKAVSSALGSLTQSHTVSYSHSNIFSQQTEAYTYSYLFLMKTTICIFYTNVYTNARQFVCNTGASTWAPAADLFYDCHIFKIKRHDNFQWQMRIRD